MLPSWRARRRPAGAQGFTVHARTRRQFYGGAADWTAVAEVKSAVRVPVAVNGDVVDAAAAREALKRSGADAVMLGRGVYGRPWLAATLERTLADGEAHGEPGPTERYAIAMQHFRETLAFYGDALGLRVFRKHLAGTWSVRPGPATPRSAGLRRRGCAVGGGRRGGVRSIRALARGCGRGWTRRVSSRFNPQPWSRLRTWISARRPDLSQAIRLMTAVAVTFAIYKALALPQGYWAVFTVVIVTQGSIGGTLGAASDRMIGTVAGALVGGAAAALRPRTALGLGAALVACIGLTAYAATRSTKLKVAPVTAAILLLSQSGGLTPELAALYRVVEIAFGGVVGVLATRAHPARTLAPRRRGAGRRARWSGSLRSWRGSPRRPEGEHALSVSAPRMSDFAPSSRRSRRPWATRSGSARRGWRRTPSRPRCRARSGACATTSCWSAAPCRLLSPGVAADLGPAAAVLMRAEAALAARCAVALRAVSPVPRKTSPPVTTPSPPTSTPCAAPASHASWTSMRRGRVFGLAFTLESLHRDLADLGDRVDEVANDRRKRGAPAQRAA